MIKKSYNFSLMKMTVKSSSKPEALQVSITKEYFCKVSIFVDYASQ